jgi:endonuclease/exonuclease/phosphatase family metal-dependent hydrolase
MLIIHQRIIRVLLPFILIGLMGYVWGCGSGTSIGSSDSIRVMTFNIAHGRGTDGVVNLKRIARVIREAKADIVALQEVDRWTQRTKGLDIITELADLTGMTYAFGKTVEYDGGDYGNGVLTRFPILEERSSLYPYDTDGEVRGLMLLILDIRGQETVFVNTHLDHREKDADRRAAIEELIAQLRQHSALPAIMCGDFNDIPSSSTYTMLSEHIHDSWERIGSGSGFTYPSSSPTKRIDYIFSSKQSAERSIWWKPVSAAVIQTDASDHLPVLVEFRLSTME